MRTTAGEYHRQRRGNCAQSVAYAWGVKHRGAKGVEEVFDGCGGGRAPGGLCGALYASCKLAGAAAAETIRQRFVEITGGLQTCRDIRASNRVPCSACVEWAAELLESHAQGGRP
jgi:hypothetical protein